MAMSYMKFIRFLRWGHLGKINDYLTRTFVVVPPMVTR